MRSITEQIRELANSRKVELKSIASGIDITPQGLNNALNSDSWKVETLAKIADYLGVDITYFFRELNNHTITENRNDKNFLQKGKQVIGEVHESSVEYKSNNSSSYEQTIKILEQTIENLKEMNEIYKESMLANKQRADELFIEKQELKAELKQVKTLKK